jgi:predicted kinase
MELVILIGLPAAGKTRFFQQRFAATHVHVSKDAMPNARQPERRQRALIEEALKAGRSLVVDNTNPTVQDRQPLIALGRTAGARVIGYFFDVSTRASVARNASRSGKAKVPPVAIFTTAKRLQPPTYAEGFDQLFIVRLSQEGDPLVEAAADERQEPRTP